VHGAEFEATLKCMSFVQWRWRKQWKFSGEFAAKCKRLPRAAGSTSNELPLAIDQPVGLDSCTGLRARFLAKLGIGDGAAASGGGVIIHGRSSC